MTNIVKQGFEVKALKEESKALKEESKALKEESKGLKEQRKQNDEELKKIDERAIKKEKKTITKVYLVIFCGFIGLYPHKKQKEAEEIKEKYLGCVSFDKDKKCFKLELEGLCGRISEDAYSRHNDGSRFLWLLPGDWCRQSCRVHQFC